MQEVRFHLDIEPEEFLRWYRGTARDVVVRAVDGRTVRFAARHLQRFVAPDGIHGMFCIRYDDGGDFVSIRKIGRRVV